MPELNAKSDYVAGGFRLTGWRVFGILVLFFGTISVVDGTMIHYALSTLRGEITPHPYEDGLAYNRQLAAAQAQDQLKWSMDGTATRAPDGKVNLDITAKDAGGQPLTDLAIKASLLAPADMKRDITADLTQTSPGHYHAAVDAAPGGWTLALEATQNGERKFVSNNRIKLN